MSELPPLLGQTDIVNRWGYTRQGLDQIMKREADFPAPIAAINGGRNRIWLTSAIEAFEAAHPELQRTRGRKPKRRSSGASKRSGKTKTASTRTAPKPKLTEAEKLRMAAAEDDVAFHRRSGDRQPLPPERYRVGYRFSSKPPFAFREQMKRDGWRYLVKQDLWLAIVRAPDLAGFDSDFVPQSGERIMTEAIE